MVTGGAGFVESKLVEYLSRFNQNLERHEVFNVASSEQSSPNEMIRSLCSASNYGKTLVKHGPEIKGEVRHLKASINKIKCFCGFFTKYAFNQDLERHRENE